MSHLVTGPEAKDHIETNLDASMVESILDRLDLEMIRFAGPHTATGLIEIIEGGTKNIFVQREIATLTQVRHDPDNLDADSEVLTVAANDIRLWADEGRIEMIQSGGAWHNKPRPRVFDQIVEITYDAVDDRELRRQVLLELTRLELARRGFRRENIAGEYSYEAEDYSDRRAEQLRRLLPFGMVGIS